MIKNNTEGLAEFQRVTVSNGIPVDGKTHWIVNETVLIQNGKIEFYSRQFDTVFTVNVKQKRDGSGTADADQLTTLSLMHKLILNLVIEKGEQELSAKEIKDLVVRHYSEEKNEEIDPNHLNRPVSELLRRKCFSPHTGKLLHLNIHVIKECLETGKF